MVGPDHEASVYLPGQENSPDVSDLKKYVLTCWAEDDQALRRYPCI